MTNPFCSSCPRLNRFVFRPDTYRTSSMIVSFPFVSLKATLLMPSAVRLLSSAKRTLLFDESSKLMNHSFLPVPYAFTYEVIIHSILPSFYFFPFSFFLFSFFCKNPLIDTRTPLSSFNSLSLSLSVFSSVSYFFLPRVFACMPCTLVLLLISLFCA